MTPTNKAVTRRTIHAYGTRTGASGNGYGKARALVVTIGPGDTLTIRPSGTQQREYVSVEQVYRFAVHSRMRSEHAQKLNAKRRK